MFGAVKNLIFGVSTSIDHRKVEKKRRDLQNYYKEKLKNYFSSRSVSEALKRVRNILKETVLDIDLKFSDLIQKVKIKKII